MPKQIRLYDRITSDPAWGDSGNKLVEAVWVSDGTPLSWKPVNVGWVYEPAALTMTGWTVFFGTLTPSVSITSINYGTNSITINWDSEYQEYINILYTPEGGTQQETGFLYTNLKTYTITGLSVGVVYSIVLRVYSETDTMASDTTIAVIPVIPTVSNFTLTSKTYSQSSFSWSATNQSTFRIYLYYELGEGTGILDSGEISSTSARTYTFTGLDPSTTYTPQIIVKSSTGNTASQNGSDFTTDPPPPPTNIDLPQISGSRAIEEFRYVTNGTWSGVGTLYYRYQWVRSLNNSTWSDISGAENSSYILQAADNGYYVTCRVGARLLVGSSNPKFSDWVDVLAPSTLGTVGYKPTISNVTASNITTTSATISWNSTNQQTYRIQLDFGAYDTGTITSSATSVSVPVVGSTNYNSTVTLGNEFGFAQGDVNFTTPTPNLPGASVASASLNGINAIDFSWTTPSNGGGTLLAYQIERSTTSSTSGFSYLGNYSTSLNSTTFTGLSSGVTYWHRIRVFNETGFGPYSNAPGVFIPTVPSAPSASASLVGTNSINLSWSLGSDGGSPITVQQIEQSINGGPFVFIQNVSVGTTSIIYSGLAAGTTYAHRIRVFNAVGVSGYSNATSVTTPTVPSAPSRPSNTRVNATTNRVSWSAPSNGGSAITGYKVYRNQNGGTTGTLQASVGGTTTTVDISGVTGNTYYFFVIATNAVGDGPQSQTSVGVTL